MKHLLQALLRWREDRVSWRSSSQISPHGKVDTALAMQLEMGPSKTKNDIVLRCTRPVDRIAFPEALASCELRLDGEMPTLDTGLSDISTNGSEPSTPSNFSSSGL